MQVPGTSSRTRFAFAFDKPTDNFESSLTRVFDFQGCQAFFRPWAAPWNRAQAHLSTTPVRVICLNISWYVTTGSPAAIVAGDGDPVDCEESSVGTWQLC
jgi:hypothetical protein